jgi:hypothetical protein
MVTVETVLDVVPALSVAVALVYYALNLRNANKTQRLQLETRRAQLYMQMFMRITSDKFMKKSIDLLRWEYDSYEDLNERYFGSPDSNLSAKWFSLLWHIDVLGYMMALNTASDNLDSILGAGIGGAVLLAYDYPLIGIVLGLLSVLAAMAIRLYAIDPTEE